MNTTKADTRLMIELAVKKVLGLSIYEEILKRYKGCNVAENREFQKVFTYFYKLRHRAEWNNNYYEIFQRLRDRSDINIRLILTELNGISGDNQIDLSFASKMLATINTDMPIYDSFVAKVLELKKIPSAAHRFEERLEVACSIYQKLVDESNALLKDKEVLKEIALFDEVIPSFAWISPMKKLDFLLWSNGSIEK